MSSIILFEEKTVRRAWDAENQKWVFAIVDVLGILTESTNPAVYWRVLKKRLRAEGNQTVTNCNGFKMTSADGKQRLTDVADTEQLLRLIQSVPSPKAEPFKLWLAQVGYERLEEIENPELRRTFRPGERARPRVPSGAPRARHPEISTGLRPHFFPIAPRGAWLCARGRTRSPGPISPAEPSPKKSVKICAICG